MSDGLLRALAALGLVLGLIVATAASLFWCHRRSVRADSRLRVEELRQTRKLREWRTRMAQAVIVERLKELGWPEAAARMTPEEVARQLCSRLAARLWNGPILDSNPSTSRKP